MFLGEIEQSCAAKLWTKLLLTVEDFFGSYEYKQS